MKILKLMCVGFVLMFALVACCGNLIDVCRTIDFSNDGDQDIAQITPMVYTAPELATVPPEIRTIKIAERVLFDFDSSVVDQEGMSIVQKVASFIEKYPDTIIVLEGHTDPRGTDKYNQALSERRADSVEEALLQNGVDPAAIVKITGFGESYIISKLHRENRRVLILSVD